MPKIIQFIIKYRIITLIFIIILLLLLVTIDDYEITKNYDVINVDIPTLIVISIISLIFSLIYNPFNVITLPINLLWHKIIYSFITSQGEVIYTNIATFSRKRSKFELIEKLKEIINVDKGNSVLNKQINTDSFVDGLLNFNDLTEKYNSYINIENKKNNNIFISTIYDAGAHVYNSICEHPYISFSVLCVAGIIIIVTTNSFGIADNITTTKRALFQQEVINKTTTNTIAAMKQDVANMKQELVNMKQDIVINANSINSAATAIDEVNRKIISNTEEIIDVKESIINLKEVINMLLKACTSLAETEEFINNHSILRILSLLDPSYLMSLIESVMTADEFKKFLELLYKESASDIIEKFPGKGHILKD
jgi:hypothetical protein